jgi:hypothetical protein
VALSTRTSTGPRRSATAATGDLLLVGHVGRERVGDAAGLPDAGRHALRRAGTEAVDRHGEAVGGQAARDDGAEAPRAPGDERDPHG